MEMLSFKNNELATSFLSTEDIKRICPMAYKSAPTNPNVSDKYVQANTATVLEDLSKLGWYPVEAKQCREKKNSAGIRSFHMIALQNPNVKITKMNDDGEQVVDAYPRIILTNSHDGFNSFKFMVGTFRLICSNGLVCGEQMVNMSIRHINYTFEALRMVVENAVKHGVGQKIGGGTVGIYTDEIEKNYRIRIEDDGVGFDTSALLDERQHLGIRNIRGRLKEMVNGTLEIESTVGVGTKALITIPKEKEK
jgi:hypothetical protein